MNKIVTKKLILIRPGYHTLDHVFANEFAKSGYEVSLFVPQKDCKKDFEDKKYELIGYSSLFPGRMPDYPISFTLFFQLMNMDFDMIQGSEYYQFSSLVALVASIIKQRSFTFLSEKYTLPRKKSDRVIFKIVTLLWGRLIWEYSSFILCHSKPAKQFLLELMPQKYHQKAKYISIGVDTTLFRVIEDTKNEKKQNTTIFLTVARFDEKKNYPYLIKAFRNVNQNYPNTKLRIVGGDPANITSIDIVSIINDEGLKAGTYEIIERVKHEELPKIYNSSDIFVLTSTTEVMGVVILEAMACGLPVIVTNIGGMTDFVDKNGFIVDPSNPTDLENRMIQYIENPDQLNEHSNASLISVKNNYRNQDVFRRHVNLFNKYL